MQPIQPFLTRGITCAGRSTPRNLSRRAQRCLHTTPPTQSGHSRWSKIKHDKAVTDGKKNKARSIYAQEIATTSKLFGPDPINNTRLADLIQKAKRAGFAKASIESAILRGQGKSSSGAALEAISIECILPSNIACIVESETESRLRTIADVKHAIKNAGGNASPCGYLFTKKGRVVFEEKEGCGVDEVFEAALEAGALDVDEVEGRVVVFTEPADTKATGEQLAEKLGLAIVECEIFWDANEDTTVEIENESVVADLVAFVDALEAKEVPVQGVYMNVRPSKEIEEKDAWADLMDKIDA